MEKIQGNRNTLKYIVMALIFTMLPFQILMFLNRNNTEPYYISVIYVVVITMAIIFRRINGEKDRLSKGKQNMSFVFKDGWYIFVISLVYAVLNFLSIDFSKNVPVSNRIFFLINVMLTATFEETVFRGIIQSRIIRDCEERGKSVWHGILISSAIFGMVHLLNLLGSPYLVVGTITQVIYTFLLGSFFGVVYYRSQNLNTAILLHFIFNVMGSYSSIFSTGVSKSDLPIFMAFIQVALTLPCLYISYRNYKKKIKC